MNERADNGMKVPIYGGCHHDRYSHHPDVQHTIYGAIQ